LTDFFNQEATPSFQWEVYSPQKAKLTIRGRLHTHTISQIWNEVKKRQESWLKGNNTPSKEALDFDALFWGDIP
jgi:hypothetical protein